MSPLQWDSWRWALPSISKKAFGKIKPSAIAAFMKLIGLCAIFLPIAVKLGFRTDKLVAILIMLGSATTVSSFVMAKNMGHEGTLSSSVVMLTTMFSAFTVTGWLYILRHFYVNLANLDPM